eukprot:3332380-Amphidinium_carterae.1
MHTKSRFNMDSTKTQADSTRFRRNTLQQPVHHASMRPPQTVCRHAVQVEQQEHHSIYEDQHDVHNEPRPQVVPQAIHHPRSSRGAKDASRCV